MNIEVALNQGHLFLIFTINGIFIGIIFDCFRILRKGFKTCNLVTNIEDILFWIISGFSTIYTMVNFSNGTLRLFMIMGLLIGFTTYILTCSKYICKYSIAIIIFLKKICKFIWNLFISPFKVIYKAIVNLSKKIVFSTKNIKKSNESSLYNKKMKKIVK